MREPPVSEASIRAGRELADASFVGVVLVGLGLAGVVALCMGLLTLAPSPPRSPRAPAADEPGAASLGHWTRGAELLERRRALSEERLTRRRWLDEEAGIAVIPIEEAMRLLVERAGREGGGPP